MKRSPGYFAESAVVVVPTVTRKAIEAVIAHMTGGGIIGTG